ncbi:MAG: DUF4168 domain-containing protein [Balneolaceae bacterium]
MKIFRTLSVAAVAILFSAGVIFAQGQGQGQPQMPDLPTSEDVSDEELDQLIQTISDLGPIQEETQEKIEEVVVEEDISFDRFQEMMMAMQNPQMADQADVSDEEMEKLQSMQPKLMEIQGEAQEKMIAKIEENGLTAQRYQSIMMGAQQDPELRTRVEEKLDLEGIE